MIYLSAAYWTHVLALLAIPAAGRGTATRLATDQVVPENAMPALNEQHDHRILKTIPSGVPKPSIPYWEKSSIHWYPWKEFLSWKPSLHDVLKKHRDKWNDIKQLPKEKTNSKQQVVGNIKAMSAAIKKKVKAALENAKGE